MADRRQPQRYENANARQPSSYENSNRRQPADPRYPSTYENSNARQPLSYENTQNRQPYQYENADARAPQPYENTDMSYENMTPAPYDGALLHPNYGAPSGGGGSARVEDVELGNSKVEFWFWLFLVWCAFHFHIHLDCNHMGNLRIAYQSNGTPGSPNLYYNPFIDQYLNPNPNLNLKAF